MPSLRLLFLAVPIALLGLAGCGGGSSATAASAPNDAIGAIGPANPVATANSAPLVVDGGPPGVAAFNLPYVTVTLCSPGSTTACQVIDHVLVDTGSFGLRIVSAVLAPSVALPPVTPAGGGTLIECTQFAGGYIWGTVRTADVRIAGELASAVPLQVVGDATQAVPSDCSSAGTAQMSQVADLQANGILGVGAFRQDCGAACASAAIPGTYYACTTTACAGIAVALGQQVANPVALFAADNNGIVMQLPALGAGGSAVDPAGTLLFGIGTQANNSLAAGATVFGINPDTGAFTAIYNGVTYTDSSFIDSGSNLLFLPDATIASCPANDALAPDFYCPAAPLTLTATNEGFNAISGTYPGTRGVVTLSIVNAHAAFAGAPAATAFNDLGASANSGGLVGIGGVDYGLPFFFGRTVYTAFEGAATSGGTGPYWAY
jgi:hypothetical protein